MAKNGLKSAEGIFRRGKTWWVRFSFGGSQVRESLGTTEEAKAIERAAEVRENHSRRVGRTNDWEKAIARYLEEKQRDAQPPGFKGTWRTFRPKTARDVGYVLRRFATWSETRSPTDLKITHLERYFLLHKKNSKAGGKTIIATIQSFLRHVGCSPGKIQLPATRELESRSLVYSTAESNAFIEGALDFVRPSRSQSEEKSARALAVQLDVNLKTKFVLCCGFWAGLRSNEIKHAKPRWFHLGRGILKVPAKEGRFESKDSEGREIPLSEDFISFLREYFRGRPADEFVLQNRTKRKSSDGTYSFKRPVKLYMESLDHPEFYPHAMRHSWITELVNSGNHTLQDVAAWSGDDIQTIEKNYWKKRVIAGSIDATLRGERTQAKQAQQLDELVSQVGELLKSSKGSKHSRTLEKLNELIKLHGTGFKLTREAVPASSISAENETRTKEVWAQTKSRSRRASRT